MDIKISQPTEQERNNAREKMYPFI